MNDLIGKIDEFLSEREKKEKYMIYASIFIVFIIICYYFNYLYLYQKVKKAYNSLNSVKKSYDLTSNKRTLIMKKNLYLNLYKEVNNLKKNLREINYLILSSKSPKLIVTKDDLFKYLKNVFNFSVNKYIFPTYKINESKDDLVRYTISFYGSTSFNNFKNVFLFFKYMENNNFISYFNYVEFNASKYGNHIGHFSGKFNIWSFK